MRDGTSLFETTQVELTSTEQVDQPPSPQLKEEDMLEDIKLYGTLVKAIKSQRMQDYNSSTYITYDHLNKKFYVMLLGSNHRYIAVAHDFAEMQSLLCDVKSQQADPSPKDQQVLIQDAHNMTEYVV